MANNDAHSDGPFGVGLMALHDRAFFDRLLREPRPAMTDMVSQGKLNLTDEDMIEVVRLIETGLRSLPPGEGLAMWDAWHETGRTPIPLWPAIQVWPSRHRR